VISSVVFCALSNKLLDNKLLSKRLLSNKPCGKVRQILSKAAIASRQMFLIPVKLYQRYISPLKRVPSCRFSPTCSAYAVDAVMEWGIVIGAVLAVWRVIRCNPFSKGGYDPVPRCPWRAESENSVSGSFGEKSMPDKNVRQ